MDIPSLIAHFNAILPLNDDEVRALKENVVLRNIQRRQFILQQRDICKHYTFVVNGCFKMYKVDDSGHQNNLQFAIEDGWIGDLGSFYSETPSELYIEAVEPSEIIQIEKSDLIHLLSTYPKFNTRFKVLVENAYVRLQKRVLQNISSTAEDRYVDFINSYPDLFQRVSNVQIASYLGITPEFLSKIRKDLASK